MPEEISLGKRDVGAAAGHGPVAPRLVHSAFHGQDEVKQDLTYVLPVTPELSVFSASVTPVPETPVFPAPVTPELPVFPASVIPVIPVPIILAFQ